MASQKLAPVFLLTLLFLPLLLFAAGSELTGTVKDAETGEPLENVEVFIESHRIGDVSNTTGMYRIAKLRPGNYLVVFRLQGYQTVKKNISVRQESAALELNVALTPALIELKHLVVTATRETESDFDLPYLVSGLSPKNISQKNMQQTPELLREEVGVVVQKTNQGGGSPIIEGLRANKLLLLVDGIRLNNATYRGGNTQYLNTVSSDNLHKIEIVHGPQSVLYGSDALGGVINLMTHTPTFSTSQKLITHGSVKGALTTVDGNKSSHFSLTTAHSNWSLWVEGSAKSFGDVTRGNNGGETLMHRLENDTRTRRKLPKKQAPNGYDTFDFSTKTFFKVNPGNFFTVAYQLNRQHDVPRYDVIEVLKDSVRLFDPQERDLFYVRWENRTTNTFFDHLTATVSLHRQFERRFRQKFGSHRETMDQFRTLTTGLQMQFNKLTPQSHHVVYGSEFYFDDVNTHSHIRNTDTNALTTATPLFPDGSTFASLGAFFQDRFTLPFKLRVTTGLRYNLAHLKAPFNTNGLPFKTIRQTSSSLTGSAAFLYPASEYIHIIASAAQGFRTPNLDDISKLGPGKGSSFYDIPNPEARPEKSLNLSAGLKFRTQQLHAVISGFYNTLHDLLVREPATFNGLPYFIDEGDTLQVFHKANAGKAYTTGLALQTELQLQRHWIFSGNISYTYGKNISDDEPLSAIPPLSGFAGLRFNKKFIWTELTMRFATEQSRLSSEDKKDLRIPEGGTPGWWTLNIRTGVNLQKGVSLTVSATNLLDRNYREHLSGFNAPGRNFTFTAQFTY